MSEPSSSPAARPASAHPAMDTPIVARSIFQAVSWFERIPHSLVALVARFSIAAVFWKSGQTKVTGFVLDIVSGEFALGWPRLSDSALALFQDEYKLPLLAPVLAATSAAIAEHLFPAMLLIGLGTRFAALALLGMTLVIQVFVYPGAYATHGTWAAVLLYLMARGPGALSVDGWIARRCGSSR